MQLRFLKLHVLFIMSATILWPVAAEAVSCTMQSQMKPADRSVYEQAARSLGSDIQAANVAAVRADTVAPVAAQFDSLANTIQQVSPKIQKATLTVDALYNLNAQDLGAGAEQADFFCGQSGSRVIAVTIPRLPPGNYVGAVLHATGVEQPQQLSLILQNDPAGSANWKLAGLFVRPLTVNGHDGVWFWTQAREFATKKQNWNAYFYYQQAAFLLNPADFFSSPNLEKLQKEMQTVKPAELPGQNSLTVNVGGQSLEITRLRTENFQGGLDLVVDYKAKGVSDPVATRTQIVELMKAILAQHSELRTGFHGLWVYAYNNSGQPFAIELPMNQIQ